MITYDAMNGGNDDMMMMLLTMLVADDDDVDDDDDDDNEELSKLQRHRGQTTRPTLPHNTKAYQYVYPPYNAYRTIPRNTIQRGSGKVVGSRLAQAMLVYRRPLNATAFSTVCS